MYIIGGLKDVKKYRYLALYFAMILVIFTQFSSKNVEKTGKFRRKNRSFWKCYEKLKKSMKELINNIKDDYINGFICPDNDEEYREAMSIYEGRKGE